jgi:hypothetical protein
VQRTQVWLAVSPIILAGVLMAHALAYRVTGTSPGPTHDYLAHIPQLFVLLVLVGFVSTGLTARLQLPPTWPFPLVAIGTFVAQEHVERLVHTGELPWLLTSPVFIVGVVLQLPVALVAWALARRLLGVLVKLALRRPRVSYGLIPIVAPVTVEAVPVAITRRPGRGPPFLHRR